MSIIIIRANTVFIPRHNMYIRSTFRAIQTLFPFLQDVRTGIERYVRRFFRSVYIRDWQAFTMLQLSSGQVIDVGSNRGQSIESILMVLPDREIIAFEPNLNLASKLERFYKNRLNVKIVSKALGDRPGSFILYMPKYRGWVFDGLASLDRAAAMSWLNSKTLIGFDGRLLSCVEMQVEVSTLDSFSLHPSVIKLDTEGAEILALKGAKNTLETYKPAILLEGATDEIVLYLKALGYTPYSFNGKKFIQGDTSSLNTFFLCEKHLSRRRNNNG